ncbi:MAG TPA: hypothetical protein VFZ25_04265 [Chloroflexota bacterium]|nr:hypothetical protein [Chloroflexota bacterium]
MTTSIVTPPATLTAGPTPTAAPLVSTATPAPVSVNEFWQRIHAMHLIHFDRLVQPLPPNERGDLFLGTNGALGGRGYLAPLLKGIGMSRDRVEARWDILEPAPGEFKFDSLDPVIAYGQRWEIQPILVVDAVPDWAVRPGQPGGGVYPPRGLDEPAYLPDGALNPANPWAFFLAHLAARYRGQVTTWEIWNEENFRDFWRGSPEDYARLITVASLVIRKEAPGSQILVGGMVVDDGTFLKSVVGALCPKGDCPRDSFDGVAWHVYGNPADILRVASLTRTILQPYGLPSTIWITESNVAVADPDAPANLRSGPDAVSLNEQAAFVLQAFATARAAYVASLEIYRVDDVDENGHYWGLVRQDLTARPALAAYRTAGTWLSHTEFVALEHPTPETTLIELSRPGERILVAWTSAPKPAPLSLIAKGTDGRLVQLDGSEAPLASSDGKYRILLPAAPPHPTRAVALAAPVIVVEKVAR